jgi:competence protein ComGC
MLTSLMFTVDVTDAKTLGGVMSKVEKLLGDDMTFRSIKQGKTTIRVGRLTEAGFMPNMIRPSWAIYDNQVRIALWPQVLMGSIVNKAPRLSANKEYQSLLASLDKDPSMLLFTHDRLWVKRFYPLILLGGTMLEEQIPMECTAAKEKMFQAFLDSPVFPSPAQTMVANSGMSGCSVKVDDHGLAMRFVTKGKNPGLTQGFLVGLMAAITIPQFADATGEAETAACGANGKAIQTAGALYHLKEGKKPQTMADLVNPSANNNNFGYLPHIPQCSKGGTYNIADGTCSKHSKERPRSSSARKSACRANQKAIATACALYQLKEGKKPKTMADLTTPTANNSNRSYLPSVPKCHDGGVYDLQGKCTKHR